MVRTGSYRGIPLYSDTTLEPNSIVFVPIGGGRLQPYEHRRSGMLADTTGSLTPSFPPETSAAVDLRAGGSVEQVPAPSAQAAPPAASVEPALVGTSGRSTITVANRPVSTAIPPTGVNNAWIDYDGHRWIADGKATPRTPDMQPAGTFRGYTIYTRGTDQSTIYVPSTPNLVVPFKRR